jgi:predicted DNA binding protein
MFEITFKIQHNCPYTRFSIKHPNVRVVEWCNNKTHVMEIQSPDIATFAKIEDDLEDLLKWKGGRVLKRSFVSGDLQLVLKTCRCNKIVPNVSDVIESNAGLTIPPDIYFGGWEEYKAIGFRDADYRRMFKDLSALGPVEILQKNVLPEKSMRDTFAITLSTVFSELTEKQIESLLVALDHGYYKIPKQITAEAIAEDSHLARTTYEEHLRKAESKILQAISPYVRLYGSRHAIEVPQLPLTK